MERDIKNKTTRSKLIRFDTLQDLVERYGIILKAGFRDRDRIVKAKDKMDQIREKYGSKQKKERSVELVRKWRGKR